MYYDITMCGIPRSGSTVVWQILQAVFPYQKILKTHPDLWQADGSMVVASIRDPHDVAASLLRVRLSRARGTADIVDNDIVTVLRRTKMNFDLLEEILTGPHAPVLRYEEFYTDHSIIYKMIEDIFKVSTPPSLQRQISGWFSIERNRRRAEVLESFNEVDRDQIHGDHIGHVVPGYWKTYFPEKYLEQVDEECKAIGSEWDYE